MCWLRNDKKQVQSVKAKRPCAEYKPSRQGYCKEHARRKAELNCRLPQGKKKYQWQAVLVVRLKGTRYYSLRHRWKLNFWGPFLERPGNFSGPKANFKITTFWKVAQFLSHKPVTFASLTDSFIVLFLKIIETLILNANTTSTKHLSGPEKFPGLSRNRPLVGNRSMQNSVVSRVFKASERKRARRARHAVFLWTLSRVSHASCPHRALFPWKKGEK